MPLSEKLDKGFESLVDTLFGSGQQEYYKGGLMRSRIGANDALTQYRGSQTRDLDYQHGLKQKLVNYLEKNKIQTRPIFTGNTLRHPAFKSLVSNKNKLKEFRNSDYIMKYGLLIGCHQGLSLKDISDIHSAILSYKKIK